MRSFLTVACVLNALAGGLALVWAIRRRHAAKAAWVFSIFAVAFIVWNICYLIWIQQTDATSAEFWCRMLMIPAGLLGGLLWHSAAIYSKHKPGPIVWFLHGSGAVNAACCFLPKLVVGSVVPDRFGLYWWPKAGPMFSLFVATYLIGFFWSMMMVAKKLGARSGQTQEPLKLTGFLFTGMVAGSTNVVPWYDSMPNFAPVGHGLTAIVVVVLCPVFLEVKPRFLASIWQDSCAIVITAVVVATLYTGYKASLSTDVGLQVVILTQIWNTLGAALGISLVYGMLNLTGGIFASDFSGEQRRINSRMETFSEQLRDAPSEDIARIAVSAVVDISGARKAALYRLADTGDVGRCIGQCGSCPETITIGKVDSNKLKHFRTLQQTNLLQAEEENFESCISDHGGKGEIYFLVWLRPGPHTSVEPEYLAAKAIIGAASLHLKIWDLVRDEASSTQLREVGLMAATLAHDIRNPLVSVTSYVSEPVEDVAGEQIRQQAEIDLHRIHTAVKAVLEFADNRNSQVSHDLAAVLNKTLALQQTEIVMANLRVTTYVQAGDYAIRAPFHLLGSMFNHLISNFIKVAIKHRISSPAMEVRAQREQDSVKVFVYDNGPGVPLEIRDKLFTERVSTESDRSAARTSGYGIGLFSTKVMAKGFGGDISYEHCDGRLAFVLRLPLA